jgi:hypothetical protein
LTHDQQKELDALREWQPIDTAPKDGTLIRVKFPSGGTGEAAYVIGVNNHYRSWCGRAEVLGDMFLRYEEQPTHWRNLPAAPKGENT